jgi:hypothetical protein
MPQCPTLELGEPNFLKKGNKQFTKLSLVIFATNAYGRIIKCN